MIGGWLVYNLQISHRHGFTVQRCDGGTLLRLTVLGSSAAYPGPNTPCSGYLVQDEGRNILLDCGTGTVGNLQTHIDLRQVNDIVISHMHADHFLDLIPYRYALRYGFNGLRQERPRLYLPPGGMKMINEVVRPFSESEAFFSEVFDISEYDSQRPLRLGNATVEFRPVKHYIPTYGLWISGSKKIAYSSDSGACPELKEIAEAADLLLCTVGRCLGADADHLWGHLLPQEAGQLARDAGVKRLLLTHLWPTCDSSKVSLEASEAMGQAVDVAEVNRTYLA